MASCRTEQNKITRKPERDKAVDTVFAAINRVIAETFVPSSETKISRFRNCKQLLTDADKEIARFLQLS